MNLKSTLIYFGLCCLLHLSIGYSVIEVRADEVTTPSADDGSDDVTEKITETSFSDDTAVTESPQVRANGTRECDPNFAVFGICVRNVIPEDVIDQEKVKIEEPNLDLKELLADSNVTIEDSVANHKVFHGRANCKCGVSSRRIVGGQPASIKDYPWTVALTRSFGSGRAFCGGTLINSRYVLTASHCVDGQSANGITVLMNEQDFDSSTDAVTERYTVANIIMHSQYNRRNIDNDIALLRLSRPVSLTRSGAVVPACLPASNSNSFAGVVATVAGWGATAEGYPTSSKLRKVDVPVVSNYDCRTRSSYGSKITDNMLCAGYIDEGGRDSCQGDSGGPLIINNGGRKTLIGIVSWGYGCAKPRAPGVYTRVSRFPEWILANTRDADWCEG